MRRILAIMGAAALAVQVAGCGDNDNNVFIGGCGDDVVSGNEQCDGTDLDGATCVSLGFQSGTLSSTSSCRFDTSGCSGGSRTATPQAATPTPVATATPGATETGPTATVAGPTATGGNNPTPTVTATPGSGPTCQQGDKIKVTIAVDYDDTSFPDVTGGTTSVQYPSGLDIPGNQSSTDQSRGENLTGTSGGFFNISDQDSNSDNIDDQVVVGLVGTQPFPPGNFASVEFDCAAGTTVPKAGSFSCTPDLSTSSGTTVAGATCSVASVTGP